MSGKLVVGLNPHGEITSLIFPGRVALQKEQIMNCIRNAFSKAKSSAEMIQKAVEDDLEKRKSLVKPAGFTSGLLSDAKYVKNRLMKGIPDQVPMEFKIPAESDEDVEKGADEKITTDVPMDPYDETPEVPSGQVNFHSDSKTSHNFKPVVKPRQVFSDSEEEELADKLTTADIQ